MNDFTLYGEVADKYYDEWDGVIDTIAPNGKIRVKTSYGYEWVYPRQLKHGKAMRNVINRYKSGTDLRFFG